MDLSRYINKARLLIQSLFYRWEGIDVCPLCNTHGLGAYSKHLGIELHACWCGFVVQNPRLTEKSLEKFYRTKYPTKPEDCERLFQRGIRRGTRICEFLDRNEIKYKGSVVFEIGCSYGGILEQFRIQGCEVIGCDLSSVAVRYGISKGLHLMVGSIDEMFKLNYKADLIILSHVLEHISEPNSFLRKIKGLLTPNGFLYIEVPALGNPHNRPSEQLGHLSYFNLDTVNRMVVKNGFQFVAGNEKVQSVFKLKYD